MFHRTVLKIRLIVVDAEYVEKTFSYLKQIYKIDILKRLVETLKFFSRNMITTYKANFRASWV